MRDLDMLENVLVDLVGAGANQVDGVEFDVSTKKELHAQARAAAIAAAREKAELYADVAGVRLGPIIHIEDIDPDRLQSAYRSFSMGNGTGSEKDLAPGKISVAAAVSIGYSIVGD